MKDDKQNDRQGVALSEGWIAVSDRLPTAEQDFLVKGIKSSGLYHDVAGLFHGKWMSQVTQDECKFEVSHWMPLPTEWESRAPSSRAEVEIPRDENLCQACTEDRGDLFCTAQEGCVADSNPPMPKDRLNELFKSRMTPYGMLVRALRMVAGTSLYEMAQHLGVKPSKLSAMEMGRSEVTVKDTLDAASFFGSKGLAYVHPVLRAAAEAPHGGSRDE